MGKERKPKLSIEQQIADMKKKNIKFTIVTEEDAKKFLAQNNYYFKLKSYLQVFSKCSGEENKGKYYNVEFAYLKELSTLDMYFRKEIINITLDVEHYLKVRLLNDIASNYEENGYDIVEQFMAENPNIKSTLIEKAKNSSCEKLILKNIDDFSAWKLVEVLSFGEFVKFYKYYYEKYYYVYTQQHSLINHLMQVKFLRNAAAHNNCLLNTLCDNTYKDHTLNNTVTSYVANLKTCSTNQLIKKMGNKVVHDFVVLLYVFSKLTKSKEMEPARKATFRHLQDTVNNRFKNNAVYFTGNGVLLSNYEFLKNIIDKMASL